MKKSVIVLFLVAFMTLGISSLTLAKDPVTVKFLTTPFGTGAYVIGTALEDICRNNHPWLRISTIETQGGVYNIKKLNAISDEERKSTMSLFSFVTPTLAQNGLGVFKEKLPLKVDTVGFSWSVVLFYATRKPEIKTLADLEGKTVAVGFKAQDSWGFCASAWLEYGAGLKDKVDIKYVGLKQANSAIIDGRVDAIVVGGYVDPITKKFAPTPAMQELLASGRDLHYLDVDEKLVANASQALNNMPAISITLPPGSIKGWDKPIKGSYVGVGWYVAHSFPEELSYEITKLVIDNSKKFESYHAIGKLITPEGLVYPIGKIKGLTMHPGSLKACKEAGLIK